MVSAASGSTRQATSTSTVTREMVNLEQRKDANDQATPLALGPGAQHFTPDPQAYGGEGSEDEGRHHPADGGPAASRAV